MPTITIRDVAEKAGVSIATVSHVINKTRYVSPELTERVSQAIEELNYQLNGIARSLKTQKTHTIGLIVSDISNPFFSALVRGVEDAAAENGYSLVVSNTDEDPTKERLYINVLMQKRIDGLIIAPTGQNKSNIRSLWDRHVPFVFVDRKMEGIEADAVLSDNVGGAYQAVKHLIELGHVRIGIILGLEGVLTSQERFEGYKQALAEFGIPLGSSLIVRGNFRVQGGMEACEKLLSLPNPPTAIFSTNNLTTIGAMKAIKKRGLKCPEDISVVSFDDFEWAEAFKPALTTVAQQPHEIGYQAARMLFLRINGGKLRSRFQEIRIKTALKIRESAIKIRNGGDK